MKNAPVKFNPFNFSLKTKYPKRAAKGDSIKNGEPLIVLEAMKMENIIKSTTDLVVKSVKIKPGDKVEKNQVLILI